MFVTEHTLNGTLKNNLEIPLIHVGTIGRQITPVQCRPILGFIEETTIRSQLQGQFGFHGQWVLTI